MNSGRVRAAGLVATLVVAFVGCGDEGSAATPDARTPQSGDETPVVDVEGLADVDAETVEIEPTTPLDADAQRAADDLRAAVAAAVERHGWRSAVDLAADGFVSMPGDPIHWYDPASVGDGVEVDPDRPEFVMADDRQVLGVMFLAEGALGDDPPDPPGAPLTRWHIHRWDPGVCMGHGGLVAAGAVEEDGTCPDGTVLSTESPAMFHVWLVGDDPFAAEMHGHHHG